MDHMMKPGVLMPSSNLSSVSNIGNNMSSSHHHHRHRVHVTAAGVDVLSPVSSSSSSVTDRCRCTLCNYVGQDDNDLHRHFREVHWQQVLIMHQQRQEVLNGAAKSIIKPSSSQKYALADQPSATSNNMLTSSTDNVELDESIVAAANTILSISASNNAAMQNQRRNTMLDCVSIAKNSNQSTPETSSDFARPRLATLGAVPNNLTNGVYHPGSKDQMIGQVDLPSSEESQLLRKMQLQHPQNLAAIAELAEYSSQVQQPQRVNNFSLELLLQQQQLLLSQQSELNPLRLAALAELRAVLASQLYATLQQQQQQPIASSATAQQTYLPLSQQQQQQNAGCIASAQNFLPQHLPHLTNGSSGGDTMIGNVVAIVGHQNASNSLSDDLQNSLQQHIREQQSYTSSRRHSIIPAVNTAPIRPSVSQSNICHQSRPENQISTATPVTINTYVAAISTASSSTSAAPASLTLRSPEEITQHISRIISENEAILEPSPILTKRRYTRQLNGPIPVQQPQQSSTNTNLSSPNIINGPREYRSNSLYSSFSPASIQRQNSFIGGGPVAFCRPNVVKLGQQSPIAMNTCSSTTLSPSFNNVLVNARGSSANNAAATAAVDNTALNFLTQVENATFRASGKLYVCKFCCLNVRHYDDLKRHEEKCAKREDTARNPTSQQAVTPPSSKIPFKKQLLIRSGQDTVHFDQALDVKNDGTLEPSPSKHRCLQPVIESHGSLVQKKHLTLPSILIPASSSSNSNLLSPPLKINNDAKNLPPTATIHLQPYTLTLKSVTSTAILDSAANLSGAIAFSPVSAQDKRKALMTERWCFKSSPIIHSFKFTDPKSSLAHYDAKMPVRVKDSLQNLQWMRSFNLRWRHSFLRYSVAKTRDSMLVTHSTYWKYAQQQMQLQQIQSKSARKHCHEHSPQSEIQNSTLHTLAKKPKIEQTLLIPSHQRSSLIDTPSRLLSQVENNSIVRGSCEGEAGAANVSFSPSNDPKNVAQHCSQNQGRRIFQRCTKRNSEDSDETMSNDGLCVVTDDEDEKCQPGQKTSHLIRELRQGLLTFSRLWARLLEDRCNERLICQTPAFSDHHSVDFQHNNHDIIRCSSAPPIFFGQLPSAFLVDHSIAVNRKLVLDPRTNHSSISSTSGSSFSAQDCRSEDVKGSNFNASVTGDTDKMEVITDSGISDISTPTDSRITPISTGGTSCNICEFCGQKFEKFSLFVLHRSVHSINRNAHKRYEYRCPYCSSNQRSRNLLQRHIATAHQRLCSQYANASTLRSENELAVSGNKVLPNTTTSGEHRSTISANNRTTFNSGQQQQQTSSQTVFNNGVTSRINNQPLSNDPRPFKCHYCEIAFRIHGHLAKHLRSKAHVMKLEALSLVPPGALSVLEEGDRLSQIDTSDCENSLRSLLKLMEKLNNGNSASKKKTPPTAAPIPPTPAVLSLHSTTDNNKNDAPHQPSLDQILQPASDLSSLACTESFSVAMSPLQDATEKSNGGGTKRSITASGVWMPPKDVSLPITVPVSPFDSSNGSDQLVNSAVINNGHLGSMAAISSQILDVQTSVLTPTPGVDASANLAFPCCICDGRFYSQLDLDVHYHADHVVMRDGSFFKCPAKDCDTVYPTRLNLRNHLILHYTGRLPCSASNSGFVSSPGENGNGCSTTAAAGATPSTPETTTNSSLVSTISAADRTDVSRSTVAALNRKLLSGHGEMGDSNGLNGNGSRKIHCSRSSSAKSHCDCQKCIKQQTDNVDNSPPPDSDASRLSASSRSHSPTPPSRPASKRSLTTTPASFSSSSMNNLQISGGNGAATSSSMYNDSNTSMSAFVGGASKRVKYVNGFYGHHSQLQQQAQLADFVHHSGLQAASPNSFVAAPGAFQAAVRSITAHQPQSQYNLVNVNQLAALNSAISPPTASILAFQQQQQQLAALKSFYNSWGGAAALLPQSILSAAAVAAASAASLPPTSHVLAHHPPVNAAEASAPVFSLDNLRCIKCSKQFYSPMAVQQHIIAEHSEAAPRAHICPFCDAAFKTQHALQTHMPCRMQSLSHQ